MNEYFKVAGDLENHQVKDNNNYFKVAGNLDNDVSNKTNFNDLKSKNIMPKEEIEDYLITVVSGKKMGFECELGTLCGEGEMIVSFEQLKEMYENGNYNIVSAQVFNPEMITIVFENYSKTNTMKFH